MVDRRTDAELVAASLSEPAAFVLVFDRHFGTIARYLGRRLSWPLAEDMVAEVFTIAFANRKSYDRERPDALPWLYGIAANMLRTRTRMEERELGLLARTGIDPVTAPSEPGDSLRFDLQPSIANALLMLSADEREVLLLVAWADLGYEQIAEALELPIGTVKSRLHRARVVLRAALAHEDSFEEVSHG
jgi:RNA polymerase sigma factor (sigma-70 family)